MSRPSIRAFIAGVLLAGVCLTPAQARTLEQIRALGTISMCAHPGALPYATNAAGQPPGYQVELGRAIAEQIGVDLRVEWLVPRRRIAEVNCDMLMDRPDTSGAQEGRRLSIPYQRTGIVLALGPDAPPVSGIADLAQHKRVGVMVSSLASVVLGRQGVRTIPYAFQADMLEDLAAGRLTSAAVSQPSLSFVLSQQSGTGLREFALFEVEPELGWSTAIALRGADEALVQAVDGALAQLIDEGTVARIYARYGIAHRRP